MPIIGSTASTFGVIISAWGILQLATTGFLFHFRSASLTDDITLDRDFATDRDFASLRDFASVRDFENDVDIKYDIGALNCWVASLLYLVTFTISAQQFYRHKGSDVIKK